MGLRVDQLYAACENGSDPQFLFSVNTYHMKLHMRIAENARCPALREAIEKEQVLIFNWLFDTAVERRSLGSDFHALPTDALANGTPGQAAQAMRQHIRHGLNEVLAGLANLYNNKSKPGWRHKKVIDKSNCRQRCNGSAGSFSYKPLCLRAHRPGSLSNRQSAVRHD